MVSSLASIGDFQVLLLADELCRKDYGIDDVRSVGQRLVHGASLCHLFEACPLRVVEGASDGHVRLDAFDPPIASLITVDTIVGVDTVELELYFDAGEGDSFMVRIEAERNCDARGEAAEQEL